MSRVVLVISFEEDDPKRVSEVMDEVRGGLQDLPDVKVYAGIREVAGQVLSIFEPGGSHG